MMSIRFMVIYVSMAVIFFVIVVFATGPLWGFRLDYEQGEQIQLIQIIIPTFLAYLSAAVTYATSKRSFPEPKGEKGRILRAISAGGLLIFIGGLLVSTIVFHLISSGIVARGSLTFSQYSSIVSVLLGVLAATTTAISTYIFSSRDDDDEEPEN